LHAVEVAVPDRVDAVLKKSRAQGGEKVGHYDEGQTGQKCVPVRLEIGKQ
jgi:hypothetical protein